MYYLILKNLNFFNFFFKLKIFWQVRKYLTLSRQYLAK